MAAAVAAATCVTPANAAGTTACANVGAATCTASAASPGAGPIGPGKAERIATLKAAQATIAKQVAAGKTRYGDVDIRDIASYRVGTLWDKGIDGAGQTITLLEGWDHRPICKPS